ncbi:CsbD family protein [Streptomyces violascens]|uniref:CsbD family protein n=1 Tax=Streptomyces violascens TaxID=67381 RepID=UPI0016769327|nr:CsbD family protein [Streptomyces violascens]GGU42708.1 hypothetical protein GCM10010289_74300 [Streptomyces violascens]
MGTTGKKMQNKAQEAVGKAKEGAGRVTGKDDLRAKGKAEQGQARAKEAARRTKEAVTERVKGKHGS